MIILSETDMWEILLRNESNLIDKLNFDVTRFDSNNLAN